MSHKLLAIAIVAMIVLLEGFAPEATATPNWEAPVSVYLPAAAGADLLPYGEAYAVAVDRCNDLIQGLQLDRTQDEAAVGINSTVDLDCFDMATF